MPISNNTKRSASSSNNNKQLNGATTASNSGVKFNPNAANNRSAMLASNKTNNNNINLAAQSVDNSGSSLSTGVTGSSNNGPTTSQLDGLVLTPAVGEFPDVEPDAVFVVPFVLHNTGTRLRSVRFTPPKSSVFRLLGMPQSIAPGMKVTMEVEFCSKTPKDFHDVFVVRTEEGQLPVELHAWFPSPHITFDRVVDLGKVSAQHPTEPKRIKLRNSGKRDGHFQLTTEGAAQGLSVTPPSGVVPAGQEREILIHYFAQEIIQFKSSVFVEVEGQPKQRMDIVAEVVEARMVLLNVDSLEPLHKLSFDKIFFGQSSVRRALLKNHGQHEMSFAVRPPESQQQDIRTTAAIGGGGGGGHPGSGGKDHHHQAGSGAGVGGGADMLMNSSFPVEVKPSEGRVPAGGSCELFFNFCPLASDPARGFEHQRQSQQKAREWDSMFSIEIVESEQRIDLQVIARAVDSDVTLSKTLFNFPDTAVNNTSDVMFSFKNESMELPISFNYSKCAHFAVSPASGRVMPGFEQHAVATFKPNQLGHFKSAINMIINNGARTLPLTVRGTATAVGAKKSLVGGVDRIPEDFRKARHFDEDHLLGGDEDSHLRSMQQDGGANNNNNDDEDENDNNEVIELPEITGGGHVVKPSATGKHEPDLLLFSEWHQKREHDHLYNSYIANSRKAREAISMLKRRQNQVVNQNDLGMIPGEGLKAPEPKLSSADEDPFVFGGNGASSSSNDEKKSDIISRKPLKVDENKLIKRKFPREPRNRNEARECKLILSPKDMQSVIVPHKWLSFGTVNVYSRNVKNFVVQNLLKTHILVSIPFSMREELADSTPTQQLVPPGQMAGFDVVFLSESPQHFQQAIYFTINETHKLKFVVFAEVLPIDIQMSTQELQFRFPENGVDTSVTMPVVLSNSGNSAAHFEWQVPDSPFTFNPPNGVVPASGSSTVEVTYTPTTSALEFSTSAQLKVKGGVGQKTLKLSGAVQPTSCSWKDNGSKEARVDFKKVSVGSVKTQTVSLKNTGSSASAVFAFEPLPGFTVTPMRGRIPAGQSEDITIQLKATQPALIKSNLNCYVRGMKQLLRLQLHAECKIPEFSIVEPVITEQQNSGEDAMMDFGGVYVGSSDVRRLVIQNHDDIVSSFLLDFMHHPEFCLTDADRRPIENTVSRDEDVTIPNGAAGLVALYKPSSGNNNASGDGSNADGSNNNTGNNSNNNANNSNDPQSLMNEMMMNAAQQEASGARGCLYRVSVAPRQTLSFYVRFTPTVVGPPSQFLLPMSLFGTEISSAALRPIVVSAEGRKPRLILNPTTIDFGSCVVARDGTSKSPNNVLVQMSNETDSVLQWEIVMRGHRAGTTEAFRVAPTSGRLQPGLHSQIQFTFSPTAVRSYHATCAVYLDGRQDQRYVDIEVKGIGSNPGIAFDRQELVLPPVPLDVPAKSTFYLLNEGYESLDVKYKIAGEGKLPVTLNWPQGQTITSSHSRLPVEVIFQSKKPTTFTVNIDFLDDKDGIFSLPLTCCADNSMLSNFSYLLWRERGIAVGPEGDKKPIVLREIESWALDRDVPKLAESKPGYGPQSNQELTDPVQLSNMTFAIVDAVNRRAFSRRAIDRLRLWLNAHLLPDPVDDLVLALQNSHGKLLMDLIENLSGKTPFSAPAKSSNNAGGSRFGGGGANATGAGANNNALSTGSNFQIPGRKQETALADIDAFESVLLFLKQYGACVSDVRPEFLLRFEEYSRLQDLLSSPTRHTLGPVSWRVAPVRLPEKKFVARATHAWVSMALQTIRVLYLARITWKSLKNSSMSSVLQQVALAEKWSSLQQDPSSVGSNILSAPEGILLKWLSVHAQAYWGKEGKIALSQNKNQNLIGGQNTNNKDGKNAANNNDDSTSSNAIMRIINFDEDLRDCRAWASCTMAYIHSSIPKFEIGKENGFTVAPATAMEFERNATILLEVLASYGFNARITARELLENSARDNLLFTSSLFHALPLYIPKTTIKFRGKLLEKITKTIELSNPSRAPVDYDVYQDGNSDFVPLDRKLRIEAKSTASFSIQISPRFSKKQESRLYFVCSHAGSFNAATLSFALETDVDHESALKVVDNLEVPMYDSLTHDVMVENPFRTPGTFFVQLQQEYLRNASLPSSGNDDENQQQQNQQQQNNNNTRSSRMFNTRGGNNNAGNNNDADANNNNAESNKQYPEEDSMHVFPDAFWSPIDQIQALKPGERFKLPLQFLPCVRGKHKVRILFRDDKVGEFAYTFVGTCLPPKSFDNPQVPTEGSLAVQKEVPIPVKNTALDKALAVREERFKAFKGALRQQQQRTNTTTTKSGRDQHAGADGNNANNAGGADGKSGGSASGQDPREIVYKVEFLNEKYVGPNPFFSGPRSFSFKQLLDEEARRQGVTTTGGSANTAAAKQIANASHVSFPFTFSPRGPGTYTCLVLLSSAFDVRVFTIEGKSRSPGMKGDLEFACPARQTIVQEIPITNNTDKDWKIHATLHGECFTGPRELPVMAGRTRSYNLTFSPPWVTENEITGTLVLKNNETQEKYTYALRGRAEEPLAENTINVECKARESRKIPVTVPNITFDECNYAVETDLPFVSGEPKLLVPKHENGKYMLHVNPQLSGKVTGSLTFYTANRQYLWYVINVTVNRPPPEEVLEIVSEVRKGVVADILISNPKDRIVDFVVRRRGEGLFGEDIITLQPNQQNAVYQLAFAPTKAEESEGAISFNNDEVGEFWFELKLKATDAEATSYSLQCELGRSSSAEVVIDNPTDTDCVMQVSNSNETNFTLNPTNIVLRPKGSTKVTVTYMPSAIQIPQEAKIVFSHAKAGKWEFMFTGSGLPPTRMEPLVTNCQVGQTTTGMVTFRNPFPMAKRFAASLKSTDVTNNNSRKDDESETNKNSNNTVFVLMTKRLQATVGPFQTLQVPFSYTPKLISQNTSSVFIHLLDSDQPSSSTTSSPVPELRWEFPIVGNAEGVSGDPAQRISCAARRSTSSIFQFSLVGFTGDTNQEVFSAEVRVGKDAHYGRAASNSIELAPMSMMEAATESKSIAEALLNTPPHPLLFYRANFEPLRPFTVNAEVLIRKESGGVWKFPVQLEAGTPEVDDVIIIEAAVNQRETVSFNLYNILPQPSPFVAYFAADSPPEFSVSPSKGILPAMPTTAADRANAAQSMSISFASTQYGKTLSGTLVIETEDMQWRYEVKGTLPQYQPPSTTRTNRTSRHAPLPKPPLTSSSSVGRGSTNNNNSRSGAGRR